MTSTLRILVDADAMPRTAMAITNTLAKTYRASVITVSSIRHERAGENHITVDDSPERTDMEILRQINAQTPTIVITQDYGLAALVLAKRAAALSPWGLEYTPDNIDGLLAERAHSAKLRRSGKGKLRLRGPKARTEADDARFQMALDALIQRVLETP